MKQLFVSVIIPNYNHERFLNERIDSVINQTYKYFEIIILDDHSSDNSNEVIEQYKNDPHITHIVYNEKNSGSTFIQWKKGIKLAKGELIWIAESDDSASPNFLYVLVSQLEKHPNSKLAFSHSFLIDSNNHKLGKDLHNNSGNSIIVHNGKAFAKKEMTKRNYIFNASMVVFRRSACNMIELSSYQRFRSCGDWLFWMNICIQGDIIEVCQKLNYFRQHDNKVTVKASKTGNDWNEVAIILSSFIDLLHLKGMELRIFRGKWTNDLLISHHSNKQLIFQKYPTVFGGSKIDILLYRLSKLPQKIIYHINNSATP